MLISDFASHYGLRLVEVLESWSPREVWALVEGLPAESLFAAKRHGGEQWQDCVGWSKDRHMLADLWDLTVAINTPKGKKAATYPRPSSKPQPSQGTPLMSMFPRFTSKGD